MVRQFTIFAAFTCLSLFSTPVFSQGGEQSGTVSGVVTDSETGDPIEGAAVILNSGLIRGEALDTVLTDASGAFSIDFTYERPRIRINIFVTAAGYQPTSETGVELDANNTATVNISMVSTDLPIDTTDVTSTGTIQGTVTDSVTGEPVSGATVILSSQGGVIGEALATTYTNAEGTYVFADITADIAVRYSINASAPGYSPASASRIQVDSGTVQTVDLALAAMSSEGSWLVTGTVVQDSAGGEPIAGAVVELIAQFGLENRYSGVSGADGSFQILVPARAFNYSLDATLSGYMLSGGSNLLISEDSTSAGAVIMVIDPNSGARELKGFTGPDVTVQYNSASGTLLLRNVLLKPDTIDAVFKIYNSRGRVLRYYMGESFYRGIDVSDLSKGLYIWSLTTGGIPMTGKVLLF